MQVPLVAKQEQFEMSAIEGGAGSEASDSDRTPPVFYTFVLVALSTTEGFNLGYMESLSGIFRERQMSSAQIAQLSLLMYPFLLSFLGAPIVDKYYSATFGKRKSYLVPCKFIIAIAEFWFSFKIDHLVATNSVTTIALTLFAVGLVQLFDFNALSGLRYELYGPKHTGLASFTLYSGLLFGNFFGYHLFVLFNSDYACRDVMGISDKALMSHSMLIRFFATVNFLSGVGAYLIDEVGYIKSLNASKARAEQKASLNPEEQDGEGILKEKTPKIDREMDILGVENEARNLTATEERQGLIAKEETLSTFKLAKTLIQNPLHRRAVLWVMFSCSGAMALRATVSLQLIKQGMQREHIVMMLGLNALCAVTNNFLLKRFMKVGQIIRFCTLFLVLYLLVIFVDYTNIMTFDKENHYRRALILYFVGIFFEGACPWMSYQIGYITATTYPKFAATYSTTFMGLVNLGKFIPISTTLALLDSVNYTVLFFTLDLANIAFLLLTYRSLACQIDDTPIEEYHKVIQQAAAEEAKQESEKVNQ
jgi:Acetyl-coenzyme A transporter 1